MVPIVWNPNLNKDKTSQIFRPFVYGSGGLGGTEIKSWTGWIIPLLRYRFLDEIRFRHQPSFPSLFPGRGRGWVGGRVDRDKLTVQTFL